MIKTLKIFIFTMKKIIALFDKIAKQY